MRLPIPAAGTMAQWPELLTAFQHWARVWALRAERQAWPMVWSARERVWLSARAAFESVRPACQVAQPYEWRAAAAVVRAGDKKFHLGESCPFRLAPVLQSPSVRLSNP